MRCAFLRRVMHVIAFLLVFVGLTSLSGASVPNTPKKQNVEQALSRVLLLRKQYNLPALSKDHVGKLEQLLTKRTKTKGSESENGLLLYGFQMASILEQGGHVGDFEQSAEKFSSFVLNDLKIPTGHIHSMDGSKETMSNPDMTKSERNWAAVKLEEDYFRDMAAFLTGARGDLQAMPIFTRVINELARAIKLQILFLRTDPMRFERSISLEAQMLIDASKLKQRKMTYAENVLFNAGVKSTLALRLYDDQKLLERDLSEPELRELALVCYRGAMDIVRGHVPQQ